MKMKDYVIIILAIATGYFGSKTIVLSNNLKATKENLCSAEQELDCIKSNINDDVLSEWDKFTLALMKVESNYEPDAVSSVGAKGYFQIMPIYVAEVNRVHKTNYVYEDVVNSFEQSYEVFTLMQEAHNSEYDMDRALELHNGDHKWYRRRVYKEMKNIEKYEEMRMKVKNINI